MYLRDIIRTAVVSDGKASLLTDAHYYQAEGGVFSIDKKPLFIRRGDAIEKIYFEMEKYDNYKAILHQEDWMKYKAVLEGYGYEVRVVDLATGLE